MYFYAWIRRAVLVHATWYFLLLYISSYFHLHAGGSYSIFWLFWHEIWKIKNIKKSIRDVWFTCDSDSKCGTVFSSHVDYHSSFTNSYLVNTLVNNLRNIWTCTHGEYSFIHTSHTGTKSYSSVVLAVPSSPTFFPVPILASTLRSILFIFFFFKCTVALAMACTSTSNPTHT